MKTHLFEKLFSAHLNFLPICFWMSDPESSAELLSETDCRDPFYSESDD